MSYSFHDIETKWQKLWEKEPSIARKRSHTSGKKYYCLDMFPYPSGSGLHVGHWRGYVLSDVYARVQWLKGDTVLHPMGWDAFGLPAENDALKKGIHPAVSTAANIETFKKQLKQVAALYDWSKELNTTDPGFYKWTQWIFLKMFKAGLAYQEELPINWCPSCLTGLANEEVVAGSCERCGAAVEQKKIRQWVLKITAYAEKLLAGLDTLDWPEKVKLMQKNWIGKSEGLVFSGKVKNSSLVLETFNAHFEAFASDSYVVIAPDHKLLEQLIVDRPEEEKEKIRAVCQHIIELRKAGREERELTGIFTGMYLIDPVHNKELPIWVASFALAHYGTGIVRCSAHDERDFAFAKKYGIELFPVLFPPHGQELIQAVKNLEICYTDMQNGILEAPAEFAGRRSGDCRQAIIDYCVKNGFAQPKVTYKLRDWLFSRQRYWGEPIPLIHCALCGIVPVPEEALPVKLPDVEKYQPTGTGESPLAGIDFWVNTHCPHCKNAAKRETNTMPQWAGSSWYFLRYPNPYLTDEPFSQKDMHYWLPVDLYVGGVEHAILHLLYARFYTKVLHDLGYVPFDEPFVHLFNQGMINKYSEKTGLVEKMSKSKGNVVNPDDIVHNYGSDALRMYILFMGPPELDCEWQDNGLDGVKRFLKRFWNFMTSEGRIVPQAAELLDSRKRTHKLIKDVQERLALFRPNTVVAAFMEWLNEVIEKDFKLSAHNIEATLVLLSTMAPHIASELLERLCGKELQDCLWPSYDESLTTDTTCTIVLQINGKLRGTIKVSRNSSQESIVESAQKELSKWLQGKQIVKTVFVPHKLVNFISTEYSPKIDN